MKLQALELKDFRSFYGEQTLQFAEGTKRNVTLVHAQNGTGKTALLNALLWAFHGETTGNFNDPNLLVNHAAVDAGRTTCRVRVTFSHEGKHYELVRTYEQPTRRHRVSVSEVLSDGTMQPHAQQTALIEQVFPREMAPYFFFDGEHATNFAMGSSGGNVRRAIREILGCTAAEHAIADLKVLERKLHQTIQGRAPDTELSKLEEELGNCQKIIETSDLRISEIEQERQLEVRLLNEIDTYLTQHGASKELQSERSSREAELSRVVIDLEREREGKQRWLGRNGVLLVGEKVAQVCEAIYQDLESKAQIPAPYNEEFVRALLESRVCICSRCLEPGSVEEQSVSQLLSTATDSTIQRQLVNVKGFCRRFSIRKDEALKALAATERRIAHLEQDQHRLQQRLGELSKQLEGLAVEDLTSREQARLNKRRKLETLRADESRLREARATAIEAEKRYRVKIEAYEVHDQALKSIMEKRNFVVHAREKLQIALDALENEALEILRANTNEIVERIFRNAVVIKIDDNFGITFESRDGRSLPPSGGQAQLVSLAFLASLIRYCAQREKDSHALLQPGTVAPFVLDSPFGQLDTTYREGAARFLPEYSSQLVLLLSSSQGDPATLAHIRDRVGSEVVLIRENSSSRPASQKDIVEEIFVRGERQVVTFWDRDTDRTAIENIAYEEDE